MKKESNEEYARSSTVSVIVPVRNVARYLGRYVRSLLVQVFRDIEIILVDDGSPGESGRIADGFAQEDGRVRAINKRNSGVSPARNVDLDVATGGSCARGSKLRLSCFLYCITLRTMAKRLTCKFRQFAETTRGVGHRPILIDNVPCGLGRGWA